MRAIVPLVALRHVGIPAAALAGQRARPVVAQAGVTNKL